MAGAPARTRKVRKILRFEARARQLLTRYERALARATGAMAQARALLDDASVLESSLTGTQLGELRRGRPNPRGVANAPVSTPLDRTFTPTPT